MSQGTKPGATFPWDLPKSASAFSNQCSGNTRGAMTSSPTTLHATPTTVNTTMAGMFAPRVANDWGDPDLVEVGVLGLSHRGLPADGDLRRLHGEVDGRGPNHDAGEDRPLDARRRWSPLSRPPGA